VILRCVLLRARGDKAFAAGADIAEFERTRKTRSREKYGSRSSRRRWTRLARCRILWSR